MGWLSRLQDQHAIRRALALAEAHQFDDALALLDPLDASADPTRQHIRGVAARHWCDAALRAAARDDGRVARLRLDRARRYDDPAHREALWAAERALRVANVTRTRAEHWARLVRVAEAAQAAPPAEGWSWVAHAPLTAAVRERWPGELSASAIHHAHEALLRVARGPVTDDYPASLRPSAQRLGLPFVRAALLLAIGRPDLAALPLAESDDAEPVVCFELARTAWCLGEADIARTALHGFTARHGGHAVLRGVDTAALLERISRA